MNRRKKNFKKFKENMKSNQSASDAGETQVTQDGKQNRLIDSFPRQKQMIYSI